MVNETRKIMGDPTIEVSPTCVRVPVPFSHSESIMVETERPITADEGPRALVQRPGRHPPGRPLGRTLSPRRPRRRQGRRLRRPHSSGPRPAQLALVLVRQRQPPQGRRHQRRPDRRKTARARAGRRHGLTKVSSRVAMRNIMLTLCYDGTDFHGWQRQPRLRTVQGALEDALQQLTGVAPTTNASGRTDAGVHALGQVVHFFTASRHPCQTFVRGLNALLPRDVRVLEAREMPQAFHATLDARSKRYRYVIDNGTVACPFQLRYSWHVRPPLDADVMNAAGRCLLGRHDFHSFETNWPNRTSSVRTILDLTVERAGDERRDRSRSRRVPVQYGSDDCRHAGPGGRRQAPGFLGERSPRRRESNRRRADGAPPGTVPRQNPLRTRRCARMSVAFRSAKDDSM